MAVMTQVWDTTELAYLIIHLLQPRDCLRMRRVNTQLRNNIDADGFIQQHQLLLRPAHVGATLRVIATIHSGDSSYKERDPVVIFASRPHQRHGALSPAAMNPLVTTPQPDSASSHDSEPTLKERLVKSMDELFPAYHLWRTITVKDLVSQEGEASKRFGLTWHMFVCAPVTSRVHINVPGKPAYTATKEEGVRMRDIISTLRDLLPRRYGSYGLHMTSRRREAVQQLDSCLAGLTIRSERFIALPDDQTQCLLELAEPYSSHGRDKMAMSLPCAEQYYVKVL